MKKYYIVRVNSLYWGLVERRIDNYKIACKTYRAIKDKYQDIPCVVQMFRITENTINNNIVQDEFLMFQKEIGKENNPMYHLNKILEHIQAIKRIKPKLCKIITNTSMNSRNFFHGLELSVLSRATLEEKATMLENLEDIVTIRRQSKIVVDELNLIEKNIDSIFSNVNSCKNKFNQNIKSRAKANYINKKNNVYDSYVDSLGLKHEVTNRIINEEYYNPIDLNNIEDDINIEKVNDLGLVNIQEIIKYKNNA